MCLGCENGDCRGNQCMCKPGYTLDRAGKACIPVCNTPCGHGKCVAPNTCSCDRGYEYTAQRTCIPKCTRDCGSADCVEPEVCGCRPGYTYQNQRCVPVCERWACEKNCFFFKSIYSGKFWYKNAYLTDAEAVCMALASLQTLARATKATNWIQIVFVWLVVEMDARTGYASHRKDVNVVSDTHSKIQYASQFASGMHRKCWFLHQQILLNKFLIYIYIILID